MPGHFLLRLHENRQWAVTCVKGNITRNTASVSGGVCAGAFCGGSWGQASSPDISAEGIRAVAAAASDNASFLARRLPLPPSAAPAESAALCRSHASGKPPATQKEKLDFLLSLDAYIANKYPLLQSRTLALSAIDTEKHIVTSDGADSHTLVPRCHLYVWMTAEKDGQPVELMAPTIGGLGAYEDFFSAPEAFYEPIDLHYNTVTEKSRGVRPDAGLKECILSPDLAGILAHEAVGHTVEADIVLGGSVAAGLLGRPVASPLISMTDFAHTAFGQVCPVPVYADDEGVLARDAELIKDGVLTGYMHNRDTACKLEAEPLGNARAFAFSDEPLIRMRNTCIHPGKSPLSDMIASVEDGYLLSHPSNGQADSTGEFMFGVEMGYEIKKGRLSRPILGTTVSGVAFDMLKTVSAVSDDLTWVSSGFCGKKQPMSVGMGGPAILCKLNVGGV
jgi:TldD protein